MLHHRGLSIKDFPVPGKSSTLLKEMHFWHLDPFLVLTLGECYTAHGEICYQHRDGIFLYERYILCVHQRGIKQQQGCRRRMSLARIIISGKPARKTFYISFTIFSKKINNFIFFLNLIQNVLPFSTFSYFSFSSFLLDETTWEIPAESQFNRSEFPVLVSRVLKQNKPKKACCCVRSCFMQKPAELPSLHTESVPT